MKLKSNGHGKCQKSGGCGYVCTMQILIFHRRKDQICKLKDATVETDVTLDT